MDKIITLTVNPALDVYTTVDKLEPEKKLRCTASTKDPGGGGVNVSRVLKRLGTDAHTIYTRGGYTGEIFGSLLDAEDIHQDALEVKNDLRQNFAVSETSSGNLYRFGLPGAELQENECEALLEKIKKAGEAEFLVASGSLPPGAPEDYYTQVAKVASDNNLKFIIDTSGKALKEVLGVGAYLIKPNKDELSDLTGKEAGNREEQKKLLQEVLDNYNVEVIVLSLGPDGAIMATQDKIMEFPAPKVDFISSIGAGDSMVAGMVCSLSRGNDIEDAVLFGIACGSATIKSPGTELLTREDAEKLYRELKVEVNGS
ncbi:MAG TPA: 1-phosphofructokinase family hexose kinase [Gillisia sp.]|nr:1-phosphofructokinase family hexose kinase [Gillisia sp.]